MQNLSKNEALLEYYHYINEGLCSLFIQSKVAGGRFKIEADTNVSSALKLAGEIIPEVGSILSHIGTALELKNEKEIKKKFHKISLLIRDDQRSLIAQYIATKLTIKRRTYLTKLTMQEVKTTVPQFQKLSLLFEDSNVF